jgi:hypothetical protein
MTTVPGTFVGGILGTNPPLTFSINGNQWLGKVSNDAKAHTLTTVTPFIQVITVNTNPPTTPTIIQQMCRSNVVAFKLNRLTNGREIMKEFPYPMPGRGFVRQSAFRLAGYLQG